eukprot:symbB.v1.2.036086.t1/scaffold5017.1/size46094/1
MLLVHCKDTEARESTTKDRREHPAMRLIGFQPYCLIQPCKLLGANLWCPHAPKNELKHVSQGLDVCSMDLLGNGSVMALGQVRKEQEWLSNRVASKEGGQRWCRLEAFLESFDGGSSQAKVLYPENRSHIVAEVVSPDCSFSLHLNLEKVDLELLSRKVLNYGVLMNTLTLLQLRSFLSQMRHHEEEHATVAKLSALGIAMQALMDAYDSFLHLSVAAPVQAFPAFKEL